MQYSLDQLRADVHEKYDFELAIDTGEVVNLRGALRLSEEERDQVEAIGKRFEALDVEAKAIQVAMKAKAGQEVRPSRGAKKPPALRDAKAVEADVMNVVREQIMLLTDDKDLGAKLIEQIGEDKALLLQVFHAYNEKTQAGEASPSQD